MDVQKMSLKDVGRITGKKLMEAAVKTSGTTEQMMAQVTICQHTGIHILATICLNHIKQGGDTREVYMQKVVDGLNKEIDFLMNAEIELITKKETNNN